MKNRNCNLQKAGPTRTRLFSSAFFTHGFMKVKHKPNVKNGGIIMSMITIVDEYGIVEKTVFIDANGNVIN